MKKVVSVVGTILAVLVLAALVIQPAPRAVASQPAVPVVEGDGADIVIAPEWTNATRPWTEAEMAAAQPMPVPELTDFDASMITKDASVAARALGAEGFQPAGYPEGMSAPADLRGNFELVPTAGGYDYPAPFTRYTDYLKYKKYWPQMAIGVLYFYQEGYACRCSAASIGYSAIWTAGHCVHSGNNSSSGWSYNMMFIPAYDYGSHPKMIWLAYRIGTTTAWYTYGLSSGGLGYDYGAANVIKVKRKLLSSKVGWLGFAWNQSDLLAWFAIGYPAGSPFDGGKQVVCAASFAYLDTTITNMPHAIGCDQTGGTSGGPWIWQYGTNYYLNGNQSFRYNTNPKELYSPYFDSGTYSLWYNFHYVIP